MRLIRKKMTALLAPAVMGTMICGCTVKQPPAPDAVSHAPLVLDEAMQQRDWPVTVCHYQDGATPGLATTFLFIADPKAPAWTPTVTETPIFAFNSLISPVVLLCSPPWQQIIYPSGGIEPSYNAMPPLPAK